jgi:aryl-alcohol dehydrogenase-like predicted oxidoreductase
MKYRTFGKLGWSVSEISIGTWAFGNKSWGPQDDEVSRSTLHAAIDNGINLIDTAAVYGGGRSEIIIGEVLKEHSEEIYVLTKVSRKSGAVKPTIGHLDPEEYYPRAHIIEECEKSLRRLGREYIDLYQFHTWSPSFNEAEDLFDAVDQLKRDGKIRAIGVSVPDNSQESVIGAIENNRIDAIQLLYNIFEQTPQRKLLPVCKQYNIGVINRVPLFEGALTGKFSKETRFHKDDFRNELFGGEKMNMLLKYVDQVDRIKNYYSSGLSLTLYALRFCLSHPAVSTVIAGMRSVDQVMNNIKATEVGQCDERELEELRRFGNVRTKLTGGPFPVRIFKHIAKKLLIR